jgi:cytochrome c oxidase cbb3-type subunit III
MSAKGTFRIFSAAMLAASFLAGQGPSADTNAPANAEEKRAPREPGQSPAASPRLKSASLQTYPPEQIRAGERRFGAQCGFCHGRDAAGGETGPDLTRSELVSQDLRGDKIGPLLRSGRVDAGMPAFQMQDEELSAIVAFVHNQMDKSSALGGGRRTVEPADLATGNVADGRAYFNGSGGCSRCHSATGDLAGVAARYKGLALLQRMLYPSGRPAPAPPRAIFTLDSGSTIVAPLSAEDEFSVTVLDPLGKPQTYEKSGVKVRVDNPMAAHYAQLGKYSDATMHNVLAYLNTLK